MAVFFTVRFCTFCNI